MFWGHIILGYFARRRMCCMQSILGKHLNTCNTKKWRKTCCYYKVVFLYVWR